MKKRNTGKPTIAAIVALLIVSPVYAAQWYATCQPVLGTSLVDGPLRNTYEEAEEDAKEMEKKDNILSCGVVRL